MSSTTPPPPSSASLNERIPLRDRWIALFLAWIIPGLGHLYQGRRFKAALFFSCILGTYFSGVCLGDGKVVHWTWKPDYKTYWYPAQVMVGLPAVPAVIQTARQPPQSIFPDRSNLYLDQKLSGVCEATLFDARIGEQEGVTANIEGNIEITPNAGDRFDRSVKGSFKGVLRTVEGEESHFEDKTPVELSVTYVRGIDPKIFPSPNREVTADLEGNTSEKTPRPVRGVMRGDVLNSRTFWDSYNAPLDDLGLESAHGSLGKFFELGMMYTMIAGLLNVLAMWDAFEGPAYGYGDEEDKTSPQPTPA